MEGDAFHGLDGAGYVEVAVHLHGQGAGQLGVITACLNWRLSKRELVYCIELVSPKLLIAEAELATPLDGALSVRDVVTIGMDYERALQAQAARRPD